MAASLDDSRPAFNQRTYAACSNSAILVGRVGFPSTSVRQRQRADAHGAFNQRTYAACSCACRSARRSISPSTSAHMLLVAQRDLIRRRTLTTFNQRTYTACSGKKYRMLVVHGLLCVHLNLFECIAQPPAEALTATISNYGREVARHTVRIEGGSVVHLRFAPICFSSSWMIRSISGSAKFWEAL